MFKVSFFFKQNGARYTGGWTENYWNNSADLTGAVSQADNLWKLLAAVHGNETILTYYRVASEPGTTPRLSRIVECQTNPTNGEVPSAATSDYPTSALLQELRAGNGRKARNWIRGVPDSKVGNGGNYTPGLGSPPNYAARIGALAASLVDSGRSWVIRRQSSTLTAVQPSAINLSTGEVTAAAHGLLDFARLKVKGARGTSAYLNGLWTVVQRTANTYKLSPWNPRIATADAAWNGTGQFYNLTYAGDQIAGHDIIRATEHAVGRPFGLLIGKTKKRK